MPVSLGLSITQNSQNSTAKTTNVTVALTLYWTGGSYNGYSKPGTVTIDGTAYDFTASFNYANGSGPVSTSGSVVAFTKTLDVAHNSDGTKTLYCSATFDSGVSSGTVTTSASKVLTSFDVDSGGDSGDSGDSGGSSGLYAVYYSQGDNTHLTVTVNGDEISSGAMLFPGTTIYVTCTVDSGYTLTRFDINGTTYAAGVEHAYVVNGTTTIIARAGVAEEITSHPDSNCTYLGSRESDNDYYGNNTFSFAASVPQVYYGFVTPEDLKTSKSVTFQLCDVVLNLNDETSWFFAVYLEEVVGSISNQIGYAPINAASTDYTCNIVTDALKPNTEYRMRVYLQSYPNFTATAEVGPTPPMIYIDSVAEGTATTNTVNIDTGSSFDSYEIYIDNGSSFDVYAAYIDDGTSWNLYN